MPAPTLRPTGPSTITVPPVMYSAQWSPVPSTTAVAPDEIELVFLRELVLAHAELAGSQIAAALLEDWERAAAAFVRVAPRAEVAVIERAHEGTG